MFFSFSVQPGPGPIFITPVFLLFRGGYGEFRAMKPADGALGTINTSGHDRISIAIGIKYFLGTHLNAYGAGFTPFPVNYHRIWTFLPLLFSFDIFSVSHLRYSFSQFQPRLLPFSGLFPFPFCRRFPYCRFFYLFRDFCSFFPGRRFYHSGDRFSFRFFRGLFSS